MNGPSLKQLELTVCHYLPPSVNSNTRFIMPVVLVILTGLIQCHCRHRMCTLWSLQLKITKDSHV